MTPDEYIREAARRMVADGSRVQDGSGGTRPSVVDTIRLDPSRIGTVALAPTTITLQMAPRND